MDKNKDCLSLHEYDSGITDLMEFEIILKKDHEPWRAKSWPKSQITQEKIDLICDKMLLADMVEPSQSNYCCNSYLVPKKKNLCTVLPVDQKIIVGCPKLPRLSQVTRVDGTEDDFQPIISLPPLSPHS